MGYLHSKTVGILHRDLKSANIFLQSDAKRSVKIGDFGLATTSAARGSSKGGSFRDKTLGSIPWMAPELFRTPAPYSHESDMYAFGCVLYEIFAGEIPYAAMPNLRQEIIIFRVGAGLMKPDLKRLNPREVNYWAWGLNCMNQRFGRIRRNTLTKLIGRKGFSVTFGRFRWNIYPNMIDRKEFGVIFC